MHRHNKPKKKNPTLWAENNTFEQINLELDYQYHAAILQLANPSLDFITEQGKTRFQFSFLLQTHLLK